MSTVNTRPRMVPESVTAKRAGRFAVASGSSIQMAGMVKATPPATRPPVDMAVWVTVISPALVLPRARRMTIERMATKMVGQGRAPNLRAT